MYGNLILISSPPASGKTYWIAGFCSELIDASVLVISPLRALVDECKIKWQSSITVMTPEEWMMNKVSADVVIFDEFHLWFYWGDSFRPLMWEAFYELSIQSSLSILLTATVSDFMKEEMKHFSSNFETMLWIDVGNRRLKYKPVNYIKAPSKEWVMKMIESEDVKTSTKLIFCKYRNEVFDLEKRLSKLGYTCLSCVGGESKYMKDKLQLTPDPDFIIATTVLSHGVNLPDIRKIFFLYKIENIDFWIQMVARGGRKGESYTVMALEKPYGLPWKWWRNQLVVWWLTVKAEFCGRFSLFVSK